jgi:Flp pilus assembly protein TadG
MKKEKILQGIKGQSLVEFALILPILLIIMLGMVEFSRAWETVNIMTSAAREAVRVMAITAPDGGAAVAAADRVMQAGNLMDNQRNGIAGQVTYLSNMRPDANTNVSFEIVLQYVPITGSFVPGIGNIEIRRSAIMRWEG